MENRELDIKITSIVELSFNEVKEEYRNATSKFPQFNSAHEGYAVIKEKLDELWDEIKKKNPDLVKLRNESKQVAAMAIRYMTDIATKP